MSWMSEIAQESLVERAVDQIDSEIQLVSTYDRFSESEKKSYIEGLEAARKIIEGSVY